MSTRSRVGVLLPNGSVKSIYIHHDGYPEGVGDILVNHYTTLDKINKLLDLGDLSSLGTEPISNPNAWKAPSTDNKASWLLQYRKLHPDNMCDTYASRGEHCPAMVNNSIEEYRKCTKYCMGEYLYLFQDGEWYVSSPEELDLKLVKEVL